MSFNRQVIKQMSYILKKPKEKYRKMLENISDQVHKIHIDKMIKFSEC